MNPSQPSDASQLPLDEPWLGLDIGGANLKGAHTAGWAVSRSFPIWKKPAGLGAALAELLQDSPPFCGLAVTMTGELADCFPTRAQGVLHILEQVTTIVPAGMLRVYQVDGQWATVGSAARDPWRVAASNWHATGSLVAQLFPQGTTLLVDVGSTTTDIIPILDGAVQLAAVTDSQRLMCGSLVYTGSERSNVASISSVLPLYDELCPTINELFATALDVHIWLGDVPEAPESLETADGRPATRQCARFRLARTVGEDGSTLADSDIDAIASQVRQDQVALIVRGIKRVWSLRHGCVQAGSRAKRGTRKTNPSSPSTAMSDLPDRIVVCGQGAFLVEDALRVLEWNVARVPWNDLWQNHGENGDMLSRCAPAYAVAKLAQQSALLR